MLFKVFFPLIGWDISPSCGFQKVPSPFVLLTTPLWRSWTHGWRLLTHQFTFINYSINPNYPWQILTDTNRLTITSWSYIIRMSEPRLHERIWLVYVFPPSCCHGSIHVEDAVSYSVTYCNVPNDLVTVFTWMDRCLCKQKNTGLENLDESFCAAIPNWLCASLRLLVFILFRYMTNLIQSGWRESTPSFSYKILITSIST